MMITTIKRGLVANARNGFVPGLKQSCNSVLSTKRCMFTDVPESDVVQPTVKCRDRPFLPGSESPNFPKLLTKKLNKYLKIIQYNDDKKDSRKENSPSWDTIGRNLRTAVDDYLDKEYAAVYIKNLPIKDSKDFSNLMDHLKYRPMHYKSGAGIRSSAYGSVYTASEEPSNQCIELHNEMLYVSNYPTILAFCCLQPSEEGGESPIAFNKDLMKYYDTKWIDKMRKKGIRYYTNLPHEKNLCIYKSWQNTFQTSDLQKTEELLRNMDGEWEWLNNGDLRMIWNTNPFVTHPRTGEEVWLNQCTMTHYTYYVSSTWDEALQHLTPKEYPHNCTYGNGEEFENELVDHLRAGAWNCAMPLKFQAGDIMIVDNMFTQHCRMSYEGERKMLVHMCESINDVRRDKAA